MAQLQKGHFIQQQQKNTQVTCDFLSRLCKYAMLQNTSIPFTEVIHDKMAVILCFWRYFPII